MNCSEWWDQWRAVGSVVLVYHNIYTNIIDCSKDFKTVRCYSEEKQGQRNFEVLSQMDGPIAELQ